MVVQTGGVSVPILTQYIFPDASAGDITNSEHKEVNLAGTSPDPGALKRSGAATNALGGLLLGFGSRVWLPGGGKEVESQMALVGQLEGHTNASTVSIDSVVQDLGFRPYFPCALPQRARGRGETITSSRTPSPVPVALVSQDRSFLMPVEEKCSANEGECQSREIRLFHRGHADTQWQNSLVRSAHDLKQAVERDQLLQQSDLFEDAGGTVHVVFKEFTVRRTDGTCCDPTLRVRRLAPGASTLSPESALDISDASEPVIGTFFWAKLVEADGKVFYVATAPAVSDYLILQRRGSDNLFKIVLPDVPASPAYVPFASQPKTGTRSDELYVDILLLASSGSAFPSPRAYHVRIEKQALLEQVN